MPFSTIAAVTSRGPVRPPLLIAWHASIDSADHVGAGAAGLALGSVALVSLVDEPLQRFFQSHRTGPTDAVARVFRPMGSAKVYGTVTAGMLLAGAISGDPDVQGAASRLFASTAITWGSVELLKRVAGRSRPDAHQGAWDFDPLRKKQVSFPSGHSAMAFMLATTLGDEIHQTWARIPLYTYAAGTAWSRLNDDRHWPSDVLAGALLGITVAKEMNGQWQVFGIQQPAIVKDPDGP
jgi:membrane-associated phospholipid phosphatase